MAELRALYRVSPPPDHRRQLAGTLEQEAREIRGAIVLSYDRRRGRERAGTSSGRPAPWGMVASIIAVLGLVTGVLVVGKPADGPARPAVGAHGPVSEIPPGAKIALTIDGYLQTHVVEPELLLLMQRFHARSGAIVVERPSDGAILALASQPSSDTRSWQQVAAQHAFGTFPAAASNEASAPGETMMALLTAIGFDTGSFDEQTEVDDSGQLKTGGITVRDWCYPTCPFDGPQNAGQMLHWASSVSAARFAQRIPVQQLYRYLEGFGFGETQAGPGLPNAKPGVLIEPSTTVGGKQVPNSRWNPAYRTATALGGTGLTATPLQLANAYAALANGGRLMQPHLVQSYTLNGKTTMVQPQVLHIVFRQSDTAERVTSVLVHEAAHGEACMALVPGFDVAAKTGAALSYNWPQTSATAVAYGPVGEADPAHRFVVLVQLQLPDIPYGSETAAPATREILRQLFQHYGLQPDPKHVQPDQACAGPND